MDDSYLNQPIQPPRITTIPLPHKLESTIPIPERVHVRDLSPVGDLSPVLEDVQQHQYQHRSSYSCHRQSHRQSFQPSSPGQPPGKVQTVSEEWKLGSKKNAARRYLVYVLVWTILTAVVGIVTGVCV